MSEIKSVPPYSMGLAAGKLEYDTKEKPICPDFNTEKEKADWKSGRDLGFLTQTRLYK